MEILRCKTRLAVLWVIQAIGFSAFLFLSFMEPGVLSGVISGDYMGMQINEGVLILFGLCWWIPWVMAWLSLTLTGSANRWINFVLGLLFALVLIIDVILNADKCSVAMVLDYIIGIWVSVLIAWYAWKLPKEEA